MASDQRVAGSSPAERTKREKHVQSTGRVFRFYESGSSLSKEEIAVDFRQLLMPKRSIFQKSDRALKAIALKFHLSIAGRSIGALFRRIPPKNMNAPIPKSGGYHDHAKKQDEKNAMTPPYPPGSKGVDPHYRSIFLFIEKSHKLVQPQRFK